MTGAYLGEAFGNLYVPSGTDATSGSNREQYFAEVIPHLLLNKLDSGCLGGDMNCITNKMDSTHQWSVPPSCI